MCLSFCPWTEGQLTVLPSLHPPHSAPKVVVNGELTILSFLLPSVYYNKGAAFILLSASLAVNVTNGPNPPKSLLSTLWGALGDRHPAHCEPSTFKMHAPGGGSVARSGGKAWG